MGHSERYLREDGPFGAALPIRVSTEPIAAVTMLVVFWKMGSHERGKRYPRRIMLILFELLPQMQVEVNIFLILSSF